MPKNTVELNNSHYTESEIYQIDKEYILLMIKNNPSYFRTLPDEWRADKDIVSFAIEKDPSSLCFTSEEFRGDKEFVLMAVQKDGFCLLFATIELQNDKELLLILRNKKQDVLNVGPNHYLEWFNERMRILEIYENDEWMKNNIPQSPLKHKPRKF